MATGLGELLGGWGGEAVVGGEVLGGDAGALGEVDRGGLGVGVVDVLDLQLELVIEHAALVLAEPVLVEVAEHLIVF